MTLSKVVTLLLSNQTETYQPCCSPRQLATTFPSIFKIKGNLEMGLKILSVDGSSQTRAVFKVVGDTVGGERKINS